MLLILRFVGMRGGECASAVVAGVNTMTSAKTGIKICNLQVQVVHGSGL